MRCWNISAAKQDLSTGPITSRALLPYLLAFVLLETASVQFSYLTPSNGEFGKTQVLLVILAFAVNIFGLLYIYRRNGGAAGKQFLERLLVLGWVTGVRFALLFMLLTLAVFGVLVWLSDVTTEFIEVGAGLFFVTAAAAYYAYLGHHVASLSRLS